MLSGCLHIENIEHYYSTQVLQLFPREKQFIPFLQAFKLFPLSTCSTIVFSLAMHLQCHRLLMTIYTTKSVEKLFMHSHLVFLFLTFLSKGIHLAIRFPQIPSLQAQPFNLRDYPIFYFLIRKNMRGAPSCVFKVIHSPFLNPIANQSY